jgi:hypothetical protein
MIMAREYLERALTTRRIARDMEGQNSAALDLLAIAWDYLNLAEAAPGGEAISGQIEGARLLVRTERGELQH